MLRIELFNEKGEKVVHEQGFISGRRVREALKMQDEFERNIEITQTETLDKMLEFVAGCFGEKVTTDAILDGVPAPELMDTLAKVVSQVMGNEEKGLKEVAKKAQK